MKRYALITSIFFIISLTGCHKESGESHKPSNSVVFAPTEYNDSFEASRANIRKHLDLVHLADEERKQNRYDQALALYKESLPYARFKADKSIVYMRMAEVHKNLQNWEKAIENYEKAAEFATNPQSKEKDMNEIKMIQALQQDKHTEHKPDQPTFN